MNVCLVGDFSGDSDEGLKNVARYFADAVESQDSVGVCRLDVGDAATPGFYRRLRQFGPDVVHYVPGISWKSVVFTRLLGVLAGATVSISAIHPEVTADSVVRALGPALVFTQSEVDDAYFEELGLTTRTLANGVDVSRFAPGSTSDRRAARERFGIDADAFVILHVGHLTPARNLDVLAEIQSGPGPEQVVVAVSDHFESSDRIRERLEAAGCRLETGYVERIEELYRAADCYVFPVATGDTLRMPLSVLEAMASNLPVVTREHPGIVDRFEPGAGLHVVDSDAELRAAVERIRTEETTPATRSKVRPYSWEQIGRDAAEAFREVLSE